MSAAAKTVSVVILTVDEETLEAMKCNATTTGLWLTDCTAGRVVGRCTGNFKASRERPR